MREKQTRLISFIEVCANIATGFLISVLLWEFVVAEAIIRGYLEVSDSVKITSIFTVTSVIRSYLWRRFFENGLHLWLLKLPNFGDICQILNKKWLSVNLKEKMINLLHQLRKNFLKK